MAIGVATSNSGAAPTTTADAANSMSSDTGTTEMTKRVDPNSEKEILNAGVEAFLPSMVSNTLMLNNTLFNFVKDAIDDGDDQ